MKETYHKSFLSPEYDDLLFLKSINFVYLIFFKRPSTLSEPRKYKIMLLENL